MAAITSCSHLQVKGFFDKMDNFELNIKSKMTWSLEEWIKEGEEGAYMKTFVNSIKYWSRKLKKAMGPCNVVLTLYGLKGDISERLQEIVDAILSLDKELTVTGFSTFRNMKYIAIYFAMEEMKKFVLENLKKVANNNVAFLSWALDTPIKNLRVNWVPLHVDSQLIRLELEKYFEVIEEKRELRVLMSGLTLPSGSISYKALLKQDLDVDNVPHLTEIDDFEALITVQGRQMECLTCGLKGHKSKNCMTPYCVSCVGLIPKVHECKRKEDTNPISGGSCKKTTTAIVTKIETSKQLKLDREKTVNESYDEEILTGSEEEGSLKGQAEAGNSVIGTVEIFFMELDNFNLSMGKTESLSKFIQDGSREINAIKEDDHTMTYGDVSLLKRKSEKKDKNKPLIKSAGSLQKTYDRRERGPSTGDKSSILFDAVKDKG